MNTHEERHMNECHRTQFVTWNKYNVRVDLGNVLVGLGNVRLALGNIPVGLKVTYQ